MGGPFQIAASSFANCDNPHLFDDPFVPEAPVALLELFQEESQVPGSESAVMGNNKREFPFKRTLVLSIASVYFSIFSIFLPRNVPRYQGGTSPDELELSHKPRQISNGIIRGPAHPPSTVQVTKVVLWVATAG